MFKAVLDMAGFEFSGSDVILVAQYKHWVRLVVVTHGFRQETTMNATVLLSFLAGLLFLNIVKSDSPEADQVQLL